MFEPDALADLLIEASNTLPLIFDNGYFDNGDVFEISPNDDIGYDDGTFA